MSFGQHILTTRRLSFSLGMSQVPQGLPPHQQVVAAFRVELAIRQFEVELHQIKVV
jgi:hypothetical protein